MNRLVFLLFVAGCVQCEEKSAATVAPPTVPEVAPAEPAITAADLPIEEDFAEAARISITGENYVQEAQRLQRKCKKGASPSKYPSSQQCAKLCQCGYDLLFGP